VQEKSKYIQSIRLNAMFEARSSGLQATADLIAAADEAESIAAARVGIRKEQSFSEKVNQYFPWLIKSLKPSTTQENQDGIDWWVIFKRNNHFPLLGGRIVPAQIKSSPYETENFRLTQEYSNNFRGKIIVIDFNLRIPRDLFEHKFMSELHRIEDIIKNERKIKDSNSFKIR
jgi:hypothetical protein